MQNQTMKNGFFKSKKGKRISLAVLITTLCITVLSFAIYEGTKKNVTLHANGEAEQVKTHAATVADLLAEQEVDVAEHDVVTPALDADLEDGLAIELEKAQEIEIVVNDEKSSIWTTERTVEKVLDEAGIEIAKHDQVEPALVDELDESNTINVDKAYQFTLVDGGKKKKYWSTSTTVGEFLKKENIKVGKLDKLSKKKKSTIKPDSTVKIVRVEKDTEKVEEEENFIIQTKSDDSLLKGQEKVVQEGKNGIIEKEYEIVIEDGKEVSRSLVAEKTIQKPEKKIVSIGTKEVVASAETASNKRTTETKSVKTPSPKQSQPKKQATSAPEKKQAAPSNETVSRGDSAPSNGKEFYVEATAYTAECAGCTGVTATGINLKANKNLKVIAVDPSVIPLGSKVWVEGYGNAIAGDTGGAIKGNIIDLHMPSKEKAYSWGRKKVKIKVLN